MRVDYCESHQLGVGAELETIDAALSLIAQFPGAALQWRDRKDRRVAVPDRFASWAERRRFGTVR